MKTSELIGAALDWAVSQCAGIEIEIAPDGYSTYHPSRDWAQGGPIIEREEMSRLICYSSNEWLCNNGDIFCEGPTPLVAAMRCYVASKLGHEIEIPDELRG